MDKEAFETIVALNKKLEGTEELDDFGKTIFGFLLLGSVKIVSAEKAYDLDYIKLTKNIIDEYNKSYRLYHNDDHIFSMLTSMHEHQQLIEDDGIALALAMIYHDIVLKYGINTNNEELSAIRFLSDFGLDENIVSDLKDKSWDNNDSVTNKVVKLILATGKTPWDFNYDKSHPISIILNSDWSRFDTERITKITDILIREEVKEFGYGEETYYSLTKKFFGNIVNRFNDVDDIRLKNIKLIYGV